MKTQRIRTCLNCGKERPRHYHCERCNAIGRGNKLRLLFRIGWRPPTIEEAAGTPLHERELIKEPVDPPFSER